MTAPRFPGIAKAALEIALDNGGINRHRTTAQQSADLERFLARQPEDLLGPIDEWLSGLSDDDMQTVCAGEEREVQTLLLTAPPFTGQLLADYFDEVC